MSKPNCSQCRHFYITWDKKTPNGCRRFGIMSLANPAVIIASAGLGDCQGFEEKRNAAAEREKKKLDLNRKELW